MVRQLTVLMQESEQMRKLTSFNKYQTKEGNPRKTNDNYFIERNMKELKKSKEMKNYEK